MDLSTEQRKDPHQTDPVNEIGFRVIARVASCFPEKFGIPRQSGLIPSAEGFVVFEKAYRHPDMTRGLEGFSHVWLLTGFHQSPPWKKGENMVRPPRLGGNRKIGVWASRSPVRPNPLGLSVVKLEEIIHQPHAAILRVSGLDLLDGTPVFDVKPYLPYADCLPQATATWAEQPPKSRLRVQFMPEVQMILDENGVQIDQRNQLVTLVESMIALEPWPAYQDHPDPSRRYSLAVAGWRFWFHRLSVDDVTVVSAQRDVESKGSPRFPFLMP